MSGRTSCAAGVAELREWLRGPFAWDVVDDAVLGCLPVSALDEIAADFGVTRRDVARELNAAVLAGEA